MSARSAEPSPMSIPSSPKPIIVASNVDKHFGSFQALRNVSATFSEGQVTAIVGPSGSGKSTFLRTLNRLEKHDGGSIVIDGIELNDELKHLCAVRREVGMVFQNFNLFSHLTILRNITIAPMRVRKMQKDEAEAKALSLLERVGLKNQAHKYPVQLSGGQQQRVAIARALAMDPKVLLFDEPTSALDPIATASIEELIAGLKERVTILIVTHNMQQAARISDYTAYMYLGEMVEFGETDRIFIKPKRKETEDYITGRFG